MKQCDHSSVACGWTRETIGLKQWDAGISLTQFNDLRVMGQWDRTKHTHMCGNVQTFNNAIRGSIY